MTKYYAVKGEEVRTIEADSFVDASQQRQSWPRYWDWEVQAEMPASIIAQTYTWTDLLARIDAVLADPHNGVEAQAQRTRGYIVGRVGVPVTSVSSWKDLESWVNLAERYNKPIRRAAPDGE